MKEIDHDCSCSTGLETDHIPRLLILGLSPLKKYADPKILFGKQPEFLSPGSCAKHRICTSVSLNPNGNSRKFAGKSSVKGFAAGISAHLFFEQVFNSPRDDLKLYFPALWLRKLMSP